MNDDQPAALVPTPALPSVQAHMTHHFYDKESGVLLGSFSGRASDLEANTPAGAGVHCADGHVDLTAHRLCLETMTLLPWSRPAPPPPPEVLAAAARASRDTRMAACDWVVTKAAEQGAPVPEAWRTYRQALRDLPLQPGFPTTIDWPASP